LSFALSSACFSAPEWIARLCEEENWLRRAGDPPQVEQTIFAGFAGPAYWNDDQEAPSAAKIDAAHRSAKIISGVS